MLFARRCDVSIPVGVVSKLFARLDRPGFDRDGADGGSAALRLHEDQANFEWRPPHVKRSGVVPFDIKKVSHSMLVLNTTETYHISTDAQHPANHRRRHHDQGQDGRVGRKAD